MKKIIFIASLLVSLSSFSLTFSKVERGQKNDFIPKNWEIENEAIGDLNKDGKEDLVLVLVDSKQKTKERYYGEYAGEAPSALLVLFKTEKGDYKLVSKVLSNVDKVDVNYIFYDLSDIEIRKNNTLQLHYEYLRGIGTSVYRWQNNRMELIGESSGGMYGAGRMSEDFSRNYSTGVEIVMESLNGSDEELNKIKNLGFPTEIKIKKKFKSKRKYTLGESIEYGNLIYEPLDEETKKVKEKFEKAKELIYSFPNE